jgi:hypothetical protein
MEQEMFSLQTYETSQVIRMQFYDESLDTKNGNLFYTSFNDQGMMFSSDSTNDPKKVKYSFRFDQMMSCRGEEAGPLKKRLDKDISALYKQDSCCVVYTVDWNLKPLKNMFCSMEETLGQCRVDSKLIQATIYSKCLKANINRLQSAIKNGEVEKGTLPLTTQIGLTYLMKEISNEKNDFSLFLNKMNPLYQAIEEEKKNAKKNLAILMNSVESFTTGGSSSTTSTSTTTTTTTTTTTSNATSSQDILDTPAVGSDSTSTGNKGLLDMMRESIVTEFTTMKKFDPEFRDIAASVGAKVMNPTDTTTTSTTTSTNSTTIEEIIVTEEIIEETVTVIESQLGGSLPPKDKQIFGNIMKYNADLIKEMISENITITIELIESLEGLSPADIKKSLLKKIAEASYLIKLNNRTQGLCNNTIIVQPITNQTQPLKENTTTTKIDTTPPSLPVDQNSNFAMDEFEMDGPNHEVPSIPIQYKNKTISIPPYSKKNMDDNSSKNQKKEEPKKEVEKKAEEMKLNKTNGWSSKNNTGLISSAETVKMQNLMKKFNKKNTVDLSLNDI